MSEPFPIVLVIDDEIQIRRFLRAGFELNGFAVHEAGTGAEAIRSATLQPIDLVIVDLGLPDMDGSEVVERIRSWSSVPIIVLSVRSDEAQKVQAARTRRRRLHRQAVRHGRIAGAGARRAAPADAGGVAASRPSRPAPLTIDLSTRAVTLNGARLTLTPKEYRLLQVLAQHAGNVVTHQHLLKEVWGSIHVHDTHYLRIFMRKLRQKIEPEPNSPRILITELGVGYRLGAKPATKTPKRHLKRAETRPGAGPAPRKPSNSKARFS